MEIAVHRLEAHYYLPASQVHERARLDRLLPTACEGALELAFAGHETGELAIRELRVPVTLALAASDGRLMVAWADALTSAVNAALAGGDETQVVAFRHRRQALLAFATDLVRGRQDRLWAFRQLGLATESALGSEDRASLDLARALAAAPEAVVPVLQELARQGLLSALVARFEAAWWPDLAARALAALGAGAAIPLLGDDLPRTTSAAVAARWRGVLGITPLGRAARLTAGPARRALAVLAVAAADPGVLAGGVEVGLDVLDSMDRVQENPVDGLDTPDVEHEAPVSDELPIAMQDVVTAHSSWGGLLFLLPVVDALALPDELVPTERPLRWSLQQLALAVVPADSGDPAVLAFCGLPPTAVPPSADAPPPTPKEADGFAAMAWRVALALAERLGEPEASLEMVHRVAARSARIAADPGWIEVHLALDDVSTTVRRAGLDLDPPFLPWLGAVVRFVYG